MTTKTLTLAERIDGIAATIKGLIDRAEAEHRDLTEPEHAEITSLAARAHDLKAQHEEYLKGKEFLDGFKGTGDASADPELRRLNLGGGAKALARTLASKMLGGDGAHMPAIKALLPTGISNVPTPLIAGPVPQGRALPSLLDALPVIQVAGPNYDFTRQSVRTLNASAVAPGQPKPESVVEAQRVNSSLSVIAHISSKIDKYLLEDSTALVDFVASELLFGLRLEAESQVISGDGVDPNILGLLSHSGIQAVPAVADDLLGTLRTGILALETAGYVPSLVAMNPVDWSKVELSTDSTGQYLLSQGPVELAGKRVWSTPVAVSLGVPAGTAVALDTSVLTLVTDRRGVQVDWNPYSNFGTNELVCRAEFRLSVSVYQAMGIASITLPAATP